MEVVSVDIQRSLEKDRILSYLLPHETKALFLLGNLLNPLQPAFLYGAKENGKLLGVCGYYPTFQSCSIFSEAQVVSKAFAHLINEKYPCTTLLGMKEMVLPAYEEWISLGRESLSNPEKSFFELHMGDFIPHTTSDGVIREESDEDLDRAGLLFRHLQDEPINLLLTERERTQMRARPIRFCLEVKGEIVTIASSNGLAHKAFQILGVVTDPQFRARGYAKAVCSHLINEMQKRGAQEAILFTDPDNVQAIRCYQSLGFRRTDSYYVARFRS